MLFSRLLFVMILTLALLPGSVFAHGGGTPVLTRVEAGPYWLYVFTEPATPQAGAEYHVTIAVTQPEADGSETPVNFATVAVQFIPEQGNAILKQAVSSTAGPGYYEADVVLPSGGIWQVQVDAISPLGSGSTSYEVEALAASGVRWGWIVAGVVIVLAGAGLLASVVGKRKPQPTAAPRSAKKEISKESA